MQAFCWSRHCWQAFDCSARAVLLVPQKPSSTSMTTATARMTVSFQCCGRRTLDTPPLALRARGLVECGAQSAGELQGVVVRPEVQEEEPRLLGQHVAMDRRYLDAVRPQSLDHRVHLLADEDEVAGDGGLTAAGRLEVDRRG